MRRTPVEEYEGSRPQPALVAEWILNAMQRGDLTDLAHGLLEAERCSAHPAGEAAAAEQTELLEAIAAKLRCSLARFERRLTSRPEGLAVHVRLLRHLARTPRVTLRPVAGVAVSWERRL